MKRLLILVSCLILSGFAFPQSTEPQMTVPKIMDVVTHTSELGCGKGYVEWYLTNSLGYGYENAVIMTANADGTTHMEKVAWYGVCVTPEFLNQLKKANAPGVAK